MKRIILVLALFCVSCAPQAAADKDVSAWEKQAQGITIIRDTWGIPHVYGKTDADLKADDARRPADHRQDALSQPFISTPATARWAGPWRAAPAAFFPT